MSAQAKLFKAPKNVGLEPERALIRERDFEATYGTLRKQWYKRLEAVGMPADQVYDQFERGSGHGYDAEQEEQFAMYSRWGQTAPADRFITAHDQTGETNRKIWSAFASGKTEREIEAEFHTHQRTAGRRIQAMQERCHADIRAGLLARDKDSRSEINTWIHLQNIKAKHLAMLANGTLGETIADSVAPALVRSHLSEEAQDALNSVTATLALAFGQEG